ncbi:hypothetical protein HNR34_003166 [Geobacillus subterraneus]
MADIRRNEAKQNVQSRSGFVSKPKKADFEGSASQPNTWSKSFRVQIVRKDGWTKKEIRLRCSIMLFCVYIAQKKEDVPKVFA